MTIFNAICSGIEITYLKSRYERVPSEIVATFTIFGKNELGNIALPFKQEEAPVLGEQYEIEVRPCK